MDRGNEFGIPYEHTSVMADDGARLAIQTVGSGPAVLLANGIGVRYPGFSPMVEHLSRHHRVILWDYRGIGNSAVRNNREVFSMERHATDALAILDSLDVGRAAVLGWSMGVPVGLEMIRRAPQKVAAYGALFGAPGTPFHVGFPRPLAEAIQAVFRFSQSVPLPAQLLLDLAVALPDVAFALLSAIRFVGRNADRRVFDSDVKGVAQVPKGSYFRTMMELARHDGRDVLGHIRCPVLIVAGSRDWITPPSAAKEMAQAIDGARLVVLEGTTHFGVIEESRRILEPIDELLADAFS